VEYLDEQRKEFVRRFVYMYLPDPAASDFTYLHTAWRKAMNLL
jgi:hypothetical protein